MRLKARGLIAEVHGDINGYIPGRAADSITLEDVLAVFRSTDIEIAHGATAPALRALVEELDENRRNRIKGITIADIYPRGEEDDAVPAAIPAKVVDIDAASRRKDSEDR